MTSFAFVIAVLAGMALVSGGAYAAGPPIIVKVDILHPRHRISPLIYGLNFASEAVLRDLNVPLNRSGGNSASLYNWRIDARGAGADWYFESLPVSTDIHDQFNHGFVRATRAAGAEPMITIPMIGWTAKLGPQRGKLAAFSVRKYGAQRSRDQSYFPDAGNGVLASGAVVRSNDPNDAAEISPPSEATARVHDLVARWGLADKGGVRYYVVDNEPSLWHQTQRSVHPVGAHAAEIADRVIETAKAIHAADPSAKVVAPEEWGWPGYFESGFDQQARSSGQPAAAMDRTTQTGGRDYLPYLLQQWRKVGHPVDTVSVHFYPQGGEFEQHGAGDRALQLLRNRSTRLLWDDRYRDTSWIGANVALIPRLRRWVDEDYRPGTPIAVTEYDWGGDTSMSGAVAQADIWGIFGREGLDLAARWTTPPAGAPVYLAMRLIRNYDGHNGAFGDLALPVTGPNPDTLAAYAARRSGDGVVTVLVINKSLDDEARVTLVLGSARGAGDAEVYRLVDGQLATPTHLRLADGTLRDQLPVQSIALYVVKNLVG